MSELTPTMILGLETMAKKLLRRSETLAEPNENTGKALLKRSLIEATGKKNGWNYYRITPDGYKVLSTHNPEKEE